MQAWVKHKLRRDERLVVTVVRRCRDGRVGAIFVARPQPRARSPAPAQLNPGSTSTSLGNLSAASRSCQPAGEAPLAGQLSPVLGR